MYTRDQVFQSALNYFKGDELAADVWTDKYSLQDSSGSFYELSPTEMHRRLAREFARIEEKYGNDPNKLSEEEIYQWLSEWWIIPQGSPMSGIGNPYQLQSISNCFVIEPAQDSYGGIFRADQQQAQIMKRRGGVGHDISNIRPKGMATSNAARTTDGIGVFMDRFSNTTREVAQNGRRGALMLSISGKHPEVSTFINIKKDKKRVTGANISVRVFDDFMRAVKNNEKYTLQWPVDAAIPQVKQEVDARTLWNEMMQAAWESAEPGILFWDNIINGSPADCYADVGYRTSSTNPCITGDTLIAVADGRNAVSIKQLMEEGKDVPVYSTNVQTGQVEIKWGRNPRVTGHGKEIWKLTLDDGTSLRATPNHKILTKDLEYVELKDLKPCQSIFPFYSFDSNGYRQVANTGQLMTGGARRNRRQYRLIHEFFNGPVDAKTMAIHHKNFNSHDDRIENLVALSHEEHKALHSERMIGANNPYHTHMTPEWQAKLAVASAGLNNGRAFDISNEELIAHGKALFAQAGKISKRSWASYAKKNNLPAFFGGEFRGTWSNFKNRVATNHKVVSVEFVGHEDVYNITVDDNHNYHVITSGESDYTVSSGICVKNCGELPLSPFDSCRLLLLNLSKFILNPYTDLAEFDWGKFGRAVRIAQRLMDDLVDLELEMINKIIAKIECDPEDEEVKAMELSLWKKILKATGDGRRTGLGETGLGDALAMMGIRYGSDESINATEEIHKALAVNSYASSISMARYRGAFSVFDLKKELHHPFVSKVVELLPPALQEEYLIFGRRNIANLTIAPAGSTSMLAQLGMFGFGVTSGCEPAFRVAYKRRKKIMGDSTNVRVDFIDDLGDKWQEFDIFHHGHKVWAQINGKDPLKDVEESPYWKSSAGDIDWVKKVDMQAAAQRWVDHSISNTTNVPADVDVETVSKIYMRGWETGCKGITIYRDGSRSGVMVTNDQPKKTDIADGRVEDIQETHAPKRPDALPCDIHRAKVKGQEYLILVGLLKDKPYEIFCGLAENMEVGKKQKKGFIQKRMHGAGIATYDLHTDDGETFENIADLFDNPEYGAFTRTLSTSLRHGVPVQYIVEQLRKDKHSTLTSFSSVIGRVLGKSYIADGTKSTAGKKCPDCGSTNLSYLQGCVSCIDCGSSKCG